MSKKTPSIPKLVLAALFGILCAGVGVLAVQWHSTGLGWLCFGLLLATYDTAND